MPVNFIKQSTEYTHVKRREFDHKRLNKVFVLWLYRSHKLDAFADKINIARAARGRIPHGFDVHHIIPLSGGGTNRLSNLCLIDKSLHRFINKNCFDPVLYRIKEGESAVVPVPDFGPIALRSDYQSWMDKMIQKKK